MGPLFSNLETCGATSVMFQKCVSTNSVYSISVKFCFAKDHAKILSMVVCPGGMGSFLLLERPPCCSNTLFACHLCSPAPSFDRVRAFVESRCLLLFKVFATSGLTGLGLARPTAFLEEVGKWVAKVFVSFSELSLKKHCGFTWVLWEHVWI